MVESLKVSADGVKKKGGKVGKDEFAKIAEYVVSEFRRREKSKERKALDKKIKEIDRQVCMEPDTAYKKNADGSSSGMAWMSELEPPNQRQALEMNNADSRRLLWPDSGSWFEAHAEMTDEYLRQVEDLSLIAGDENETRSSVNQDIVDEIVEAWMVNIHRAYDFRANMDVINAEAFKYGVGIGRMKRVKTPFFSTEIEIPQLVPVSIKNTFLDDRKYNLLHENLNIEPSVIRRTWMKWEDLQISASKGSNDPDEENGGWISAGIKSLMPDKNEDIELIEIEGDLVISNSNSESLYLPRVIVTVAVNNEKQEQSVVRYRNRKSARSSYFIFPYHQEDIGSPYAVGPLVMAHPIQAAMAHALNRAMDAATLSTNPHLFYDPSEPELVATGGPVLTPGGSTGMIGELREVAPGDPGALFNIYLGLAAQYAELTGMTGARLGQQTSSHTTAFAKDVEVSRGQIRIVDYVKSIMQGPLAKWLQACYEESLDALGEGEISVYLHKSKSFIKLSRNALPNNVFFDIFGSAGPAEDAAKVGAQVQAMQMALGIETAKRQLGEGRPLDLTSLQQEILRKGGIADVDKFYVNGPEELSTGATGASAVGGPNAGSIENAVPAALQAILSGGG